MNSTIIISSSDIDSLIKRFMFLIDQVLILNNQIMDIDLRIKKAMLKKLRRSFILSYHLRVISLEGTRRAFYELAVLHSDRICELKKRDNS